jgi:hypothetical protein
MKPLLRGVLLIVCSTCAVFGCIVGSRLIAEGNNWIWFVDWQTYSNAWARVSSGGQLYSTIQLAGTYSLPNVVAEGYAYPPASVIFFAPFASWPLGFAAWTTLNAGAFLGAIWAMVSRAWPTWRFEIFSVALLLLAMFEPFREAVGTGNISLLIAAGFGWTLVLGPKAAGPIGVMAGLFKLTPGALAMVGLRSHFKRFIVCAAVAAFLIALTIPMTGWHAWSDYLVAMANAEPRCYPANLGVGCVVPDLPVLRFAALLVSIPIAVLSAFVKRHFVAVAIAAFAYLIGSAAGDLHVHTWTVVFILAVAGVARLTAKPQAIEVIDRQPSAQRPVSAMAVATDSQ